MVSNTLSSKIYTNIYCRINYLHFITDILVRNTIIVSVLVQLDMAIFHHLNLKVFFQFPTLLGQWLQKSSFTGFKQIIAVFFSSLIGKTVMSLQKLKDGIIQLIRACEHLIAQRSKNACIN